MSRRSQTKSSTKQQSLTHVNLRITIVQACFLAGMILLAAKAFEIQVLKSTDLTRKAENEYVRTLTIHGKRGDIVDRNHKILCTTIDTLSVAANPQKITDKKKSAASLATALQLNEKEVKKQIDTDKSFVWIKRKISPMEQEKMKALHIEGIFFKKDTIRFHPQKVLAAQTTGITGSDGQGLEGLEYRFKDELKGKTKEITIERDAAGRYYSEEKGVQEALKGDTVVLTIDSTIQYIAEAALEKAVTEHDAASGMALVMIPQTGEVLAMAHFPTFNPNSFSDFPKSSWRNRCVTDPFEPGSTMKVFVAAAALEHQLATPKSIFFCENGKYKIGRIAVHDTHKYDWLTLGEVIKYSSNIGAIKISEVMGKPLLYDTLKSFGFGQKSGIECPGETEGLLRHFNAWTPIDAANISFGQGISVSALQLLTAVSAIANGGRLMRPTIVKALLDSQGDPKRSFTPLEIRQVISKETALKTARMMRTVVEEGGTAPRAELDGYEICGKTGTAQKVKKGGGYSKKDYIALFAAFAPMENPRLAVLVVVDEPKDSHYGGVVAAPAVKTIFSDSFHYLKVPPIRNRGKI